MGKRNPYARLYSGLNTRDGRRQLAAFEAFARRLMKRHGLPDEWEFGWLRRTRLEKRQGTCTLWWNGHGKPFRGGFLLFSRLQALLPRRDQRDTVLHEIAHALVREHAREKERRGIVWVDEHSHGSMWRSIAAQIGVRKIASNEAPGGARVVAARAKAMVRFNELVREGEKAKRVRAERLRARQ